MTQRDQVATGLERLSALLLRMSDRLSTLEKRGTRIPVVDDDPNAGEYGNIWQFNDGRLCWRDADGDVHEVKPTDDYRPQIPTFASAPAVSTGWRMWLRGSDGALQVYDSNNVVKTYNPVAVAANPAASPPPRAPVTSVPKPVVTRRYTHVSTFMADSAICYCPVHGTEGDLYYGRWSSTHGERRLMFGFDATAIRAALTSNAQITKVELIATNLHSNPNSGVNIRWGAHNFDTLGSGFSQNYAGIWTGHWPKVGGRTWRRVPNWYGTAFRDGRIRGLTVDQPSPSSAYYGLLRSDVGLRFSYSNTTP
jgi:hypothetical protein